MQYSIDFKTLDCWTTPRSQWTGSPLVNSAATCLVAYSGASCKQKASSAATSTARSTRSIALRNSRSARDLVERKRAAMNGLAREVQYRRLAGMLSRRGFDSAITTQVLADVLGE